MAKDKTIRKLLKERYPTMDHRWDYCGSFIYPSGTDRESLKWDAHSMGLPFILKPKEFDYPIHYTNIHVVRLEPEFGSGYYFNIQYCPGKNWPNINGKYKYDLYDGVFTTLEEIIPLIDIAISVFVLFSNVNMELPRKFIRTLLKDTL